MIVKSGYFDMRLNLAPHSQNYITTPTPSSEPDESTGAR